MNAAAAGTANAITIPNLPCIPTTALLVLTITTTNTAPAPTLATPTLPAKPIVAFDGSQVNAGALFAGARYLLTYSGSAWILLNSYLGTLVSGVTVNTPPNPTAGNAVVWNGGTTVKDAGAPPALAVASNDILKALPVADLPAGAVVQRSAFYAGLLSGAAEYTLSKTANCPAADDGIQVQPNAGTGCWFIAGQSPYDLKIWGAVGSNLPAKCTVATGSPNITLDHPIDLVDEEDIACAGAGTTPTVTTPTGVAVVSHNATGSPTQYCYQVAAVGPVGGITAASAQTCVSDGGAQLGTVQNLNATAEYERISWSPVTGAIAYLIYGWQTGNEFFIGETADTSWSDFGFKSGSWNNHQNAPNWVSTAPLVATVPGFWFTSILSGAGTTSIVATSNAPNAVTNGTLVHDDSDPFGAAIDSGADVFLSSGDYPFFGYPNLLTTGQSLIGCGAECSYLINYVQGGLIVGDGGSPEPGGIYLRDFGMDGSNGLFGDVVYINDTNQGRIVNLEFDSYYTNMQIGNGSGTYYIQDLQSFGGLNGDYGIYIWGTDAKKTQIIHFDGIRQYGGSTTTATLMLIDGQVGTIHVDQAQWGGSSMAGYQISNVIGASNGPNGIFFNNPACNGQQSYCFNVLDSHHLEIANPFIQLTKGSSVPAIFIGPNAYQTWLNGVGRIYGTSTWGIRFQGHGLYVSDQSIFNNDTGSIWCDGGENITINGGDSLGVQSDSPNPMVTATGTAIKLGSTCGGRISISGNWVGLIANIEDDVSPATQVAYLGYPLGSPVGWPANIIDTTGNKSLTVAAFPGLYAGTHGRIATLDIGADSAAVGRTFTFDTAANIAAVVPIGSAFTIRILQHTHNTIALAGGAGTTATGTIPSNGGTGMVAYYDLHGVVTAGPAVTIT